MKYIKLQSSLLNDTTLYANFHDLKKEVTHGK